MIKPFWSSFYENSEIVVCENATHFVTEETPLCVLQAIESFVSKHKD